MELHEKNGNILYILNVLKKYSDADHILSSTDIAKKIKEEYDVSIDSRTVRRNITILIEKFNYDISTWNENKLGYYYIGNPDTDFEPGELRAIIDTFSYSNFINDDIAKNIINKCKNQQSIYLNESLDNYNISMKNTKTQNKEVILNIEIINKAISNKKKISFDYYKYKLNPTLKEELSKTPIVTPYKLFYGLSNFYLVALEKGNKELYTYRIDRIKNVTIIKEKASTLFSESEIDFDIKNNVGMFMGDVIEVEIECENNLLDNVLELYGKDIKIKKIDDNRFYAKFYTNLEGFHYWCLRNIEHVKVLSPNTLIKRIKKAIKNYK